MPMHYIGQEAGMLQMFFFQISACSNTWNEALACSEFIPHMPKMCKFLFTS